ncbi:ATP-binding cassette domain-containing protein [Enterococcus rivorum]|uniref:UvrABC system protein A n=3 Tax=Enterococcus rivorum TaxID=762845 RepID=A0A1E5KV94_9ENTE|nr:excinuclease ABC subunit UvrA [Enterococcus rivorum]MBP2100338.1 excinuclease UvrABC ATPase subunit [Enterococcus rivorum]OEH81750.1 daunorubicin resistance protein DrrC [Enterococcus rivorum]
MSQIIVRGARTRNLKNVNVAINKHQINAFVGVSGSGKSSLVFSTIAAEAQRQMNQTYPSYVRNRMPHLETPIVDSIEHLSPAIIVNQKALGDNRRSTVGTVTDINPTLRLLFSRFGKPFIGYSDRFSFNNPNGMCQTCQGLGIITEFKLNELLDYDKTLNEGAIRFETFQPGSYRWKRYVDSGLFDNDKKLADFTEEEIDLLLYSAEIKPPNPLPGWYKSALFEGLIPRITHTFIQNTSKSFKRYLPDIQRVTKQQTCFTCHGYRLNEEALSCKINGKHIGECLAMQLDELQSFLMSLKGKEPQLIIENALQQINYLCRVGLDYLNLARETGTLSGGESQRIKLVRSIGSSLSDMMYIFDEPSVGLHPQDIQAIGQLIEAIKNKGNTILLIDHDPKIIQLADTVFELGPGAGIHGGEITSISNYTEWEKIKKEEPPLIRQKKETPIDYFSIKNITKNNVHNLSVSIPKERIIAITGVAGSGKSSFAKGILENYPEDTLYVTQKNIRGSSRSTLISYIGLFDDIRKLYSQKNQVAASYFSFNGKGACPVCKGKGYIETELAFLDPIRTTCEACLGEKYQQKVLQYTYRGKNIVELLSLSVEDSLIFFSDQPKISQKINWLYKIGLGYLTLGQTLNTLSGGELQRLKLALNLDSQKKIIILDEPTTGLSKKDIQALLTIFDELLEKKNTLLVIEHNTEFIQLADWMIEFGPSSGSNGGQLIYEGTPLAAKVDSASVTGKYL